MRCPAAAGVKVRVMVHEAPAASDAPQLSAPPLTRAKSAALTPPIAISLIVSGALPVFFRSRVRGAPVVPFLMLPKVIDAGSTSPLAAATVVGCDTSVGEGAIVAVGRGVTAPGDGVAVGRAAGEGALVVGA